MATELPPGDCKAKEPQLYPYCFRPKPWCILLITFLSLENAFCNILDVQKRNECIIWTYFQSMLRIRSTIGNSPMNRSAFKHGYRARGFQSQEATKISILFPAKTMIYFLTTSLSLEKAFCSTLDVQTGNASFEHIFNPCRGSVVLSGSHLWIGMLFM